MDADDGRVGIVRLNDKRKIGVRRSLRQRQNMDAGEGGQELCRQAVIFAEP